MRFETIRVVVEATTEDSIAREIGKVPGVEAIAAHPEQIATALGREGEVLVCYHWRPEFLTPGLRWVQAFSAGIEQFPLDRLQEQNVTLTSAQGNHREQVSEHVFALLLGLTRNVAAMTRNQLLHEWRSPEVHELAGMTMGVLGLGNIGEAVARRADAFDMRAIGTKRDVPSYRGVAEEVFPPGGTLEVCRRSEVIVIVLPAGQETDGLVGTEELAALGPGWLINVGRGSMVDEDAMIRSLTEGELRGAGLDVYEQEPLPADSPLWDLPNVIISPRIAWMTPRQAVKLARLFELNLAAYRGGADWTNRIA